MWLITTSSGSGLKVFGLRTVLPPLVRPRRFKLKQMGVRQRCKTASGKWRQLGGQFDTTGDTEANGDVKLSAMLSGDAFHFMETQP